MSNHGDTDLVSIGRSSRHDASASTLPQESLLTSLNAHLEQLQSRLTEPERAALSLALGTRSLDSALLELGSHSPESMLDPDELGTFGKVAALPSAQTRAFAPYLVLIMKATKLCNLRCTYCRSWSADPNDVMHFEVLARTIRSALSLRGLRHVQFVWHGGESTLRTISFYRKALWLQQRFRQPGQEISNTLQTNGTTLTADWLEFMRRYQISAGVSLDGPPEIHDQRRLDTKGRPTSERVRAGLEKLERSGVPHGLLMVVDDAVLELGAERLLGYLLEIGARQVALLNVGPEGDPDRVTPGDYVEFSRYVDFLREIYRLWWPTYTEEIAFREISSLVNSVKAGGASYCVYGENCVGHFYTVEPNGDISHCDKYQGDGAYKFANILDATFEDILSSAALTQARSGVGAAMEQTEECPWFKFCQGGCPHDRYVRARRGIQHDEHCCGWKDLISDIANSVGSGSPGSTRPNTESGNFVERS